MDARVTISEDTIKNAGKLSNHQKFALRLERLKKLDESGELAQCKNKHDVRDLRGLGTNNGMSWVWRMIRSRYLVEERTDIKENDEWVYKYSYHEPRKRRRTRRSPQVKQTTPVILSRAYEPKADNRATIKYADGREITLEGYSAADMATIIKALQ